MCQDRVKAGDRFIGQDHFWILHQGPGDANTLLLSPAEFISAVAGFIGYAYPFERLDSALFIRLAETVDQVAPEHVLAMYGPDVRRKGSYAYNCLMARRLIERGTRFVQLMHAGWDQHRNLYTQLEIQCRDTDAPSAALVLDLKQRGKVLECRHLYVYISSNLRYCMFLDPELTYGL